LKLVNLEISGGGKSIALLVDFDKSRDIDLRTIEISRSHLSTKVLSFFAIIYWADMRGKSKSFEARLRRYPFKDNWLLRTDQNPLILFLKRKLIGVIFHLIRRFSYKVLWFVNHSLVRILEEYRSKRIIYITTGGTNSNSDFLARWTNREGIELAVVYDNWDGIFTKSVHFEKNFKLFVWGEQGRREAIEVHEFPAELVHALGSPRTHHVIQESRYSVALRDKVLFAGGSLDWREELKQLEIVAKSSPLSIIYLPHPKRYRQSIDDFKHIASLGVEIDIQMIRRLQNSANLPKLSFYENILRHAKVVISPMSTMALESALIGLPTIIPTENENPLAGSQANLLQQYGHLKGLSYLPNVFVAQGEHSLKNILKKTLAMELFDVETFYPYFLAAPTEYEEHIKHLFPSTNMEGNSRTW
jgi:hypothetical protein